MYNSTYLRGNLNTFVLIKRNKSACFTEVVFPFCCQSFVLPLVYKSLNGLAPDYLKSMSTDRRIASSYSLQTSEGKLAAPLPRTNFLKETVSAIVVRFY